MIEYHPAATRRLWPTVDLVAATTVTCLAALAVAVRLVVGPRAIDDAYITFRYARNIAEGVGFVYNAGEPVLGTTTPLYALLMAGLHWLSGADLPWLALAVNAAADAATTIVLLCVARRVGLGGGWAYLLATLFAVAPLSIAFASGGMESSVFVFFVVGAAAADLGGRTGLAGLLAGLATLTRPEGVLIGGLVLGRHLFSRRLPTARTVAAYLAPLLPWIVFATWYFGNPLPQSVMAKASHYRLLPAGSALTLLAQLGLPGFNPLALQLTEGVWYFVVGLVVGAVLLLLTVRALPALVRSQRRYPERWPLLAFAPLLALAYALAGVRNVYLFNWYMVPLVPFYLLGLVAGLRQVVVRFAPKRLAYAGTALLVAWMLLGLNLGREPGQSIVAPLGASTVREEAFIAAASFLAPRLGPETVVALPEIGAFGYISSAKILDTAGLVTPRAARYYPLPLEYAGNISAPPDLIRSERPDYLVAFDIFLPRQLTEADWFRRDYSLLASFDAPVWGGNAVLVYGLGQGRGP